MIDRQPAPGIADDVPTPDQVLELRAAIATLQTGLGETPRDRVARMVGRLASIYRDEKLSRKEAALRLATYQDLLCDIPPDLLSLAFKRAAQRSRFFPTVAEIREQVRDDMRERHWRLFRAQYLAEHHARNWVEPQPPISDQERKAVAAGMGRLAAMMTVSAPKAGGWSPEEIEARETRREAIIARVEREATRSGPPPVDM